MKKKCALIFILSLLYLNKTFAQTENLSLSLQQAEQLFVKQNHDLIAQNYQISQAQADVITARLFNNPEVSYENMLYNPETKKFLQTSRENGQYAASISQLVTLAGKRNKSIKLAQIGVKQNELAYFDLLRTLRFQLRSLFYKIYFGNQSLNIYHQQISSTQQLLTAYQAQLKVGNIAAKDVIRIQSLLISLQTELTNHLNDLEDDLRDFKIICGISAPTPLTLTLSQRKEQIEINKIPYTVLLDSAISNRADLKLAKNNLAFQESNLKLQKAMAIPDVEFSFVYDFRSDAVDKYTGIGIKIPIPLFNRNQGEIKKAKIGIDDANNGIKKQQLTLENEVFNSYQTALRNEKLIKQIDPKFSTDFEKLATGLIKNFKERNVSLIEFLDLYDAYRTSTLQLNQLNCDLLSTQEEINYVTGSSIFK